jgi:phosphate transport system substrate-binding protein
VRRALVCVVSLTALAAGCGPRAETRLSGTGSTFIAPLMERWAVEYRRAKGVEVEYEPVGSVVGLQRFSGGLFDFSCTDAVLSEDQLHKAREAGGEVVHVPLVVGAVVPVYNLDGVTDPLTLSGPVLADIYLGKVTKWDDEAIRELNPSARLPDKEIAVVHRSEGSGTTFIWTEYLSKVSPEWKRKVGVGASVAWPVGEGKMGNADVAARVQALPGSIGYVALNYALEKQLPAARVKNREGVAVQAGPESVAAAADAVPPSESDDLRYSLTDAPGKDSYPICGTTWAVVYARPPRGKAGAVIDFLRWATHDGQEYAEELHYGRLPKALLEKVEKKLDQLAAGG